MGAVWPKAKQPPFGGFCEFRPSKITKTTTKLNRVGGSRADAFILFHGDPLSNCYNDFISIKRSRFHRLWLLGMVLAFTYIFKMSKILISQVLSACS
jgi:hypothetical protein